MAAETVPPTAAPAAGLSRWVPTLPSINLNTLNPFATHDGRPIADSTKSSADGTNATSTKNRSFFAALNPIANGAESRDVSPTRSSTMFPEPDMRSGSEDGESREGSVAEEGARRRSRRCNKAKTTFTVCHPPPASLARAKLHRRPRSLLQLHKMSPNNARPVPAFEVIPSANFNVRLTKSITRMFKARHGLCQTDMVVLQAEKYATVDDVEDDEREAQGIIGLICNRRKEGKEEAATERANTKICMASGVEWEAYPLPNGGYEFFSTDEHGLGLKVRWVPKRDKDGTKATIKDGSTRFNFSTINPNSRRHPVIASLSKAGLDVYDSYKVPDAVTPNPTPNKHNTSALDLAMEDEGLGNDVTITDDALREMIVMTSVWVTFKEGWSPTFKYDDKDAVASNHRAASSMSQLSPTKSGASSFATPPGSPAQPALEKRASIKSVSSGILRRGSLLSRGNRASQASVPEENIPETTLGRSESVKKTGRARGDSTSTVLVHRAASNRRKNNQATWRPDLLATQDQLNETSREDLNGTPPRSAASQPDGVWESPAEVATPQRREQVAQPLVPIPSIGTAEECNSSTPTPAQRTTRRLSSTEKLDSKRVSDATTETASSVQHRAIKPVSSKKQKRGWRRILCGGHDF